ncbi:MAG: GxxExxY protein [Betaproteobacteria bacterium]|nr:GxxExxY protein [Rhodocyclales bacterium]
MNHRDTEAQRDPLTEQVIGCAIEVHRALGPGLLESAYEECLALELGLSGIATGLLINFNVPVLKHGLRRMKL